MQQHPKATMPQTEGPFFPDGLDRLAGQFLSRPDLLEKVGLLCGPDSGLCFVQTVPGCTSDGYRWPWVMIFRVPMERGKNPRDRSASVYITFPRLLVGRDWERSPAVYTANNASARAVGDVIVRLASRLSALIR
jgi:hypothetical protein